MSDKRENKIEIFGQTFRFATSSLFCYCLEYLLYLAFLNFVTFLPISVSNLICRILACTANYLINRKIVFRSDKKNVETAIKYIIVMVSVIFLSTALITLFNRIFATENNTVAKYIKSPVDTALFFLSYTAQRLWVFKKKEQPPEDTEGGPEEEAPRIDDDYDGGEDV
ncbi:MAG: GtrA family protein [Clostridia bacterium]|nr:GtrA family protein [Clostridia bacterium]